jgi:hypothetical protein
MRGEGETNGSELTPVTTSRTVGPICFKNCDTLLFFFMKLTSGLISFPVFSNSNCRRTLLTYSGLPSVAFVCVDDDHA